MLGWHLRSGREEKKRSIFGRLGERQNMGGEESSSSFLPPPPPHSNASTFVGTLSAKRRKEGRERYTLVNPPPPSSSSSSFGYSNFQCQAEGRIWKGNFLEGGGGGEKRRKERKRGRNLRKHGFFKNTNIVNPIKVRNLDLDRNRVCKTAHSMSEIVLSAPLELPAGWG